MLTHFLNEKSNIEIDSYSGRPAFKSRPGGPVILLTHLSRLPQFLEQSLGINNKQDKTAPFQILANSSFQLY